MKLIKRVTRSLLPDSKWKSFLLLLVTSLNPNIEKLVKYLKSH